MTPLVVETYVIGHEDQPESIKHIDHDNRSDRVWLGKHCFWAFRNNRRIVTYPLGEGE